MNDMIFLLPVVTGWLAFFAAVGSYFFYRRHGTYSQKGRILFAVFFVLCFVSAVVWAVFRNL